MCKAVPFKIDSENIINLALVQRIELDVYTTQNGNQFDIIFYFDNEDNYYTIHFGSDLARARSVFNMVLSTMEGQKND